MAMEKAYGAIVVHLINQLESTDTLNVDSYPSLETLLKYASRVGDMMQGVDGGEYMDLILAEGKKLFANKTKEEKQLEVKRLEEFKKKARKEGINVDDDNDADEEVKKIPRKKEWFAKAKPAGKYQTDFDLKKVRHSIFLYDP